MTAWQYDCDTLETRDRSLMADPNKSRSITQRGHVSSPGRDTSPLPRVAGDKERGKKGGEENFELQSLSLKCKGVNKIT